MTRAIALLALLPALSWAQTPTRPVDPLAEFGFQHFYNLEYPEALTAFRAEVARNPNSPDAYNHVAQTVLYREMFRSGALESELVTGSNPFLRRAGLNPSQADEQEFQDSISRAMALADARLQANSNDIPALYAQGVSYGLRGNYHFLVRKAYTDALRDAAAARKAHNRVTEIDPRFNDARLLQGVYDYVLGSLPPTWRMLGFFAGFRGDRERGVASLKQVADQGRLNRVDAEILLCAVYRRERRAKEAVPLLSDLIQRFPQNFLFRLELVQMYGDLGEKESALAVIGDVDRLKRDKTPGYERLAEEKLRYTRGNLRFWYNDLDLALEDLKVVTDNPHAVDLNTNLYAWLRTGQIYDLKKKREDAKRAYLQTVAIAPASDAANAAQNYLLSRYKR
jgi:tetratricopeptide (TPR) repeat protein